MKKLPLLFLLLPSFAPAATLEIHVKGLVCAYCAQGAVRALEADDAVASATADLDHGILRATLKPGRKLASDTARKLVGDAGLEPTRITEKP